MTSYYDIAFTPTVLDLQNQKGSREMYAKASDAGLLGGTELDRSTIELIRTRDSFYMATVGETGWPYVQHRGGEAGFVKVLDERTIGWAERWGNRQYLGSGNITTDGRVAMIFMDYPARRRLKIYGQATHHPEPADDLLQTLEAQDLRTDGAITVEIVAAEWNCPKYITPRYTEDQVIDLIAPLQARIEELEAALLASSE
jgi:uncharacterized protein